MKPDGDYRVHRAGESPVETRAGDKIEITKNQTDGELWPLEPLA